MKRDILYSKIHDEDNSSLKSVAKSELNTNHTHFILVDDGSCDAYGKEIEFRSKLENELRKGKSAAHYEKLSFIRRKINDYEASTLENNPESESDEDESDINETFELKPGLKSIFL